MTSTIDVPVWLVLLIVILAAVTLLNHFLLPGLRWFLRGRVNRVMEEVGSRLRMKLPTFQLTKRDVLIDRLVYDPEVMKAVAESANTRKIPRDAVMAEVVTYAREMVPAFNAYFYFKIGLHTARRFVRAFYRVRLGHLDRGIMDNVPDNTAIVFFINHRSNIDYLLVTYLASKSAALSYGAGEWARIWPFSSLLRFAGAYILRRDASDPLYRKVLERYVQMATASGVPHALFVEGQLSRDGKVHKPKLGMLGYITKTFDPKKDHDIVFIPVATNFDRIFEERTLIVNKKTDFRGRGAIFVLGSTTIFMLTQIWRKIRGRWQGFGVASAGFGEPLSLRQWSKRHRVNFSAMEKDKRYQKVGVLANELMARVASVIPVLAIPLLSTVLLQQESATSENDLAERAHDLMMEMRAAGAHISLLKGHEMDEIRKGIESMSGRKLIVEDSSGHLSPAPHEIPLLEYYANSIAHLQPGQKWTNSA